MLYSTSSQCQKIPVENQNKRLTKIINDLCVQHSQILEQVLGESIVRNISDIEIYVAFIL